MISKVFLLSSKLSPYQFLLVLFLTILVSLFQFNMESRILLFNGDEANYIDHEQLDLTVKLSPLTYGTTTYNDVFRARDHAGLNSDDIGGLDKVSSTGFSYSLYLYNENIKKRLMELKVIGSGKGQFGMVCLTEQTVKLKIHCLPIYYSNRLLKAIFVLIVMFSM